jgi:hypothetical protein
MNDADSIKQINTTDIECAPVEGWQRRLWYWYNFEMRYIFPRWMRESYDWTRNFLFPRNRWATKCIPRSWSDKTALIPEFLYAAIIDFVEGEEALETIVWSESDEFKIKEIYHWAKYIRHEMREQISKAYPELSLTRFFDSSSDYNKKSYEELYGEVNRLEAEYDRIETEYLTWMIQNRSKLWT